MSGGADMKYSLPEFFLTATAVALLGANWQIHRPKPEAHAAPAGIASAVEPEKPQPSGDVATPAGPASPDTVSPPAQPESQPRLVNGGSHSSHSLSAFDWAQIETSDYKQYVSRLRAIGFPEDLVRSILIADVDKLYEPREQALKPKPVPYDAPMSQRSTDNVSPAEWQRVTDLWQLRVEKQQVLEEILGCYVSREILRTPISRNYEAYEYAISLLPVEKRDAVQLVQETEILVEGMNKSSIKDHAAELESFKKSCADRNASLHQILSQEEFERYEMNTTPAGTELARRVIGMAPTDQELLAMFRIAYKNWFDTGGVYGRWRAIPVPPEQIAAADREMNASLKEALGPDRFLDYQMAVSVTGQQMRNFAARFALPRETLAQAFELQSQVDQIARMSRAGSAVSGIAADPAPARSLAELQSQLQQLLAPQLWEAWQAGKNLRVSLDP